ncbi:MAG: hypothetical protein M1831_005783 [Alyxoria varia]|nr:MAG: hypothetical protein M1831_005783 [Alyxoria varia]
MKVGKPKSKRTPVRLRHKIEKASAAKQRKQRKQARKNPQWRSRLKKDPGIPNLFPYKERLLNEMEEQKRSKEEEQMRKQEEARERRRELEEEPEEDDAVMRDEDNAEIDDNELLDYEDSDEDGDEAMADDLTNPSNPMAALLASARSRAQDFSTIHNNNDPDASDSEGDSGSSDFSDTPASTHQNSTRTSQSDSKAFHATVNASDIILYVLDARNPGSTRSREVERQVTSNPEKRLLFIVNKIDLVPPEVLQPWLTHLRRSFPTLPLKASASSSPSSAGQTTFTHRGQHQNPRACAQSLLKSLKTYAASSKLKRAINVGVIGYPNVGKSSVINALTSQLSSGGKGAAGRHRGHGSGPSCPTGAEAGVTTAMREVKLDGKLKLLDSPGIVFPTSTSTSTPSTDATSKTASGKKTGTAPPRSKPSASESNHATQTLLSLLPTSAHTDPYPAISLLLSHSRTSPALLDSLKSTYGIPELLDRDHADLTTDFLVHVARRRGRLGRGGVPDLRAAAMCVVGDVRAGRCGYWVGAPADGQKAEEGSARGGERERERGDGGDGKEIVRQWAEEFRLDGLWGGDGDGDGDGGGEETDGQEVDMRTA